MVLTNHLFVSFIIITLPAEHRTKINNAYRSHANISHGVPEGSISGFLVNIDICDSFLWDDKCDIASYADDSIPYTFNISLDLVLKTLESSTHDLCR